MTDRLSLFRATAGYFCFEFWGHMCEGHAHVRADTRASARAGERARGCTDGRTDKRASGRAGVQAEGSDGWTSGPMDGRASMNFHGTAPCACIFDGARTLQCTNMLRRSLTRNRNPRIDAFAELHSGRLSLTSTPAEDLHTVGRGVEEGRYVDCGNSSLPCGVANRFRNLSSLF